MPGDDLGSYRWTVLEYAVRCELGADIREVLVEGVIDFDVLTRAFRRWGLGVSVVESTFIQASKEELEELGVPVGAKGKLIAVAHALAESSGAHQSVRRVAVVVDRDYDEVDEVSPFLFFTDGYAIENYALNWETLHRFSEETLGRAPRPKGAKGQESERYSCSGCDLYRRIIVALTEIASVRMTLRDVTPPVKAFAKWLRYAQLDSAAFVSLDGNTLLRNILTTEGRASEIELMSERRKRNLEKAKADVQRWVRGHDFVDVLQKVLKSKWGRRRNGEVATAGDATDLSRRLVFAVDPAVLDASRLFQGLRQRFASQPAGLAN